ncbi:MAG TPA: hypothetical protein VLL54_14165 [Pyrinomonadaceae bacterium]|nr:hypothetical protein [Pyrinomonadaceae bacterium]
MKESSDNSGAVNKAALDHARALMIHASDIRMKNFNFFLVIMGVVVTAYLTLGRENARLILGGVGMLVSLAFLLLDIRGRQLLDAADNELIRRELELGISIRSALLQAKAGKLIKKAISHTFVYRAIYMIGLVLSFVLAIFAGRIRADVP